MKLTATGVRNLKAGPRIYKRADGRGLYIEVHPNGAKYWRQKYRYRGKEKRLSLGTYPDTSLAEARASAKEIRNQLKSGMDPSAHRKAQKNPAGLTFEAIALEWLGKQEDHWAESHSKRVKAQLRNDLFPFIGNIPISSLSPMDVLAALRRIEDRGAIETAHRARQKCGEVFRYAVATGRAERDVTQDLKGALRPVKGNRRAAITEPKSVGALLRAIDGYEGQPSVMYALRLLPLVFVRPGELRFAEWRDFDLTAAMWRIPAHRTKLRREHLVPLSRQALEIIEELKPLTGPDGLLFPGIRSTARPISDNTLNAALRRLGYSKEDMTAHGFRAVASTLLNEQGWNRDAIERQLAHAPRDEVRAAYHRSEHLEERTRMMQEWADHLDWLKSLHLKSQPGEAHHL